MRLKILVILCFILSILPLPLLAQTESPWNGEGELGFLMTSGNSETESLNAKFDLTYETDRWRHNGRFEALYSAKEIETDAGESEMETSAEKYLVSGKSGYKFTENNYAFLTGTYEDDRFSGYDYQTSVSAGYGRRVFKTERMLLEMEIGPGYRYNKLDSGGDEEEAILRGYALFTSKLTQNSSFKQELGVETGADQTVTKSVSSVKAQVIGALSMKAAFTLEHTSSVPADTEKTDTETALTMVYSF
ncbi:MAG: YdiY family protein [Desulfobacterales bacterium]